MGEMGRGLVVRAVSAPWLEDREIFCLPIAYIKASSSLFVYRLTQFLGAVTIEEGGRGSLGHSNTI